MITHIFQLNKQLISLSASALDYYRSWSLRFASRTMQTLLNTMGTFLENVKTSSLTEPYYSHILSVLESILAAQEQKDYILIADIIEINLIPVLNNIQQAIIQYDTSISMTDMYRENIAALTDKKLSAIIPHAENTCISASDGTSALYQAEPATIGSNTLKYESSKNSFYFHSNNNPYVEGHIWADTYGNEEYFNYTVLGFGMGYHIRGLLEKDRRYRVTVIESSIEVLSLAFTYGDIADILSNPRFKLIYSTEPAAISSVLTDFSKDTDNIDSRSKLLIHYPSMTALDEGPVKSALKQYFIKLDTIHSHQKYLKWNFYYNTRHNHPAVDCLKPVFYNKTVILLAGGPSLEKSVSFLKNYAVNKDSCILLSVGTSYRGLVAKGIIPDYVIITDAGDRIFKQISGISQTKTSLIYLSTASDRAVNEFNGKKYIMYQKGFKDAENYSAEHNYILFETGGSVSTAAADLALRFQCKKLITLGLDLSYPEHKLHSFKNGTVSSNDTSMLQVSCVAGGTVSSTNVLTIYKKWIEERISKENHTDIINISDGARIENAKNFPLSSLNNIDFIKNLTED